MKIKRQEKSPSLDSATKFWTTLSISWKWLVGKKSQGISARTLSYLTRYWIKESFSIVFSTISSIAKKKLAKEEDSASWSRQLLIENCKKLMSSVYPI